MLVIIAIQLLAPHFFSAVMISVARPFWRTEFALSSGSLATPASLLNENESLKMQLADMHMKLETVRSVEAENAELKGLFARSASSSESRTLAAVLVRPPKALYDEFIIDIGTDYGISTTSLVYASGNILIGRITDVFDHTARVKLFSSPRETPLLFREM